MKRKGLTMTARHIAQVRRFGKWGSMKPRELKHEQRALGTIPEPALGRTWDELSDEEKDARAVAEQARVARANPELF